MREMTNDLASLSRSYARRSRTGNGTASFGRTESRQNTASGSRSLSTAQALRFRTAAHGFARRIIARLKTRLMNAVKEVRKMRVETLRSQAYAGGDADGYVRARKEYWYRYEK